MEIATTFRTSTGTMWTVTGSVLTRISSERGEHRDAYAAIPNAIGRDGQAHVSVRVGGVVTFVADGVVQTTGRISEVVRVASVASAA